MAISCIQNRLLSALAFIFLIPAVLFAQPAIEAAKTPNKDPRIQLISNPDEKKIDVYIDGALFTAYIYPTTIKKPVLYPVNTESGLPITRGFPLNPLPHEKVDHPHQVGVWFNHGDVNNLDFWNNSDSIPVSDRSHYGTIYHKSVDEVTSGKEKGKLRITTEWKRPDGVTILDEKSTFFFSGSKNKRYIDRITTLTANEIEVTFEDSKEGLLAIRVIRELEQKVGGKELLLNENLVPEIASPADDKLSQGLYRNSNGLEGDQVWGKRAYWVKLGSRKDGEAIGIIMMDHPDNPNYPNHWMARGYGLFAANPLGSAVYTEGKETFNFKLSKGESVTFKYRIFIYNSENPDDKTINAEYNAFIDNY